MLDVDGVVGPVILSLRIVTNVMVRSTESCPEKCLNTTCDQRTGSCNYCKEGFEGKSCEHEITTHSLTTGCINILK